MIILWHVTAPIYSKCGTTKPMQYMIAFCYLRRAFYILPVGGIKLIKDL